MQAISSGISAHTSKRAAPSRRSMMPKRCSNGVGEHPQPRICEARLEFGHHHQLDERAGVSVQQHRYAQQLLRATRALPPGPDARRRFVGDHSALTEAVWRVLRRKHGQRRNNASQPPRPHWSVRESHTWMRQWSERMPPCASSLDVVLPFTCRSAPTTLLACSGPRPVTVTWHALRR